MSIDDDNGKMPKYLLTFSVNCPYVRPKEFNSLPREKMRRDTEMTKLLLLNGIDS